MNKKEYIPGVCNIGVEERKFRRNFAVLGFVASLLFLFIILVFSLPDLLKSLIFIPVFLTAISYLQDKFHFCAEFGLLGKYNFSDKVGKTITIEQKEYLRLDRIKAIKIICYSLAISIIIVAIIDIVL